MAAKTTSKSSSRSKTLPARVRTSRVKQAEQIEAESPQSQNFGNKFNQAFNNRTKKLALIAGIFILALGAFAYLFRGLFVAAVVNGQPISRLSVVKQLEQQGGKNTLESLITEKLIMQEASQKGLSIDQSQIDGELKKIEDSLKTQGTTLDAALAAQNLTKDHLINQIKLQLLVQKMTESKVKVTDKEINDYIEQNRSQFPEDTNEAELKKQATEQLKQEKQAAASEELVKSVQEKANILRFVNY